MPSPRASRWILFAATFCLLPLPFQMMEVGFAPALRVVFLTGIFLAITLADGFSEITRIILPLLAIQAVVYPLLLWWLSGAVIRLLEPRTSERLRTGLVVAFSLALLVLGSFDVYVTPVSSTTRHSNLVGLLD